MTILEDVLFTDNTVTLLEHHEYLGEIHNDVEAIVQLLGHCSRNNIMPTLCFDFDVLHTFTANRSNVDDDESFWTTLALTLSGFEIAILPGTLFEIIQYLERRIKRVKKIADSSLGRAFLRSVQNLSQSSTEIDQNQFEFILERFLAVRIAEPEYYLFCLLQNRLGIVEAQLPQIDRELFYACMLQLSRGARVNLFLNNRVDAYNYCLLDALNKSRVDERQFIIVTQSVYMKRLDIYNKDRDYFYYRDKQAALQKIKDGSQSIDIDQIWQPRRVAILQLLSAACKTVGDARKFGLALLTDIGNVRTQLMTQLHADDSRYASMESNFNAELTSKNIFLDLISRFTNMKKQIDDATLSFESESALASSLQDPLVFFHQVQDYINEFLLTRGYKVSLEKHIISPVANMNVEFLEKDNRFTYQFRARIAPEESKFEDSACIYFRYETHHLFVINNPGILEEFISVVNALKSLVSAKIAVDALQFTNDQHVSDLNFKITVGTEQDFYESDSQELNSNFTSEQICRAFGIVAQEINFLRLDNDILSATFEGAISTIASRFSLEDEFSFFVRELTRSPYRGTNFSSSVKNLLQHTEPL